jgi:hypothetical protein
MQLKSLIEWITNMKNPPTHKHESSEKIVPEEEKKQELPHPYYEWIDNDGLLRDEGVLFGIAEADMVEKVAAIENRFTQLSSPIRNKINLIDNGISKLNNSKEEIKQDISRVQVQKIQLETSKQKMHYHLFPMIIQLVAYASICYFNFYLVKYCLAPVFKNYFIPVGVYLFGLFSVFIGRTMFYNNEQSIQNSEAEQGTREKWKVWLEELGIPLVVSFFIVVLSYKYFPVEQSVAVFLLFFFLFSFAGKGLINSFYRVRKEWGLNFVQIQERFAARTEIRKLNKLLKKWDTKLVELSEEINKKEAERLRSINQLDAVMSVLIYKIKLFKSEYNLAKETSQTFSDVNYSVIKNN